MTIFDESSSSFSVPVDLTLFDALRRPSFERSETGYSGALLFMLSENADGWCLRAVDKKNQPVSPNYRAYSGRVRDRVKAYQLALSEDEPTFHWGAATDSANDGVAIARHPRRASQATARRLSSKCSIDSIRSSESLGVIR